MLRLPLLSRSARAHPSGRGRPEPAAAEDDRVQITTAPERVTQLGRVLGPGYAVRADRSADVVVWWDIGPTAIRELRHVHPHSALLVVLSERAGGTGGNQAATVLEAGAVGCVVAPSPQELAAHVQALVRRRRLGDA